MVDQLHPRLVLVYGDVLPEIANKCRIITYNTCKEQYNKGD